MHYNLIHIRLTPAASQPSTWTGTCGISPVNWSRYCLWQTVGLEAGKLEWQRNRLVNQSSANDKLSVVRGALNCCASNYEVRELGKSMSQLALQHWGAR